ncbi:hypothetical protein LEP1GSC196_0596 [Leptospira meyeri serovar Semaranga str. Veldrot Semarang 173]|nr:hypothetical protein LEP1GSC196_0596 [Leptospira meyeri serovar Semaranga str. Veldrot Semarang 173]
MVIRLFFFTLLCEHPVKINGKYAKFPVEPRKKKKRKEQNYLLTKVVTMVTI